MSLDNRLTLTDDDFIWRYSPRRTEPKLLDAIFVQRQSLLAELTNRIREGARTERKRHVLLVGPRGIGKTHLISLLHHHISSDHELACRIRIAWLLEDETITSFVQLLKRIFDVLADEYPEEFSRNWLTELMRQTPTEIQLELQAKLVSHFSNKTLLLLIENLDFVFKGMQEDDQIEWRAFLNEYPFAMVISTSARLFHSVQEPNKPLFDFFELIQLQPLSISDAVDLLRRIALRRGQTDLVEFLLTPEGQSRVRVLHHLAGGNHRLYVTLSGFVTRASLADLVQPFEKMSDELTPYHQECLRWLSPRRRIIVELMCAREAPCTPKEIARQLMSGEKTVSSQLRSLTKLGYVEKLPSHRESLYELAEPLMRLVSKVKEKSRTPLRRLADFLLEWYRTELRDGAAGRAKSDRMLVRLSGLNGHAKPDSKALQGLPQDPVDPAKQQQRSGDLLALLGDLAQVHGTANEWCDLACYQAELNNHGAAIDAYQHALEIDPRNLVAWRNRSSSCVALGQYAAALECYDRVLELNRRSAVTWLCKGIATAILGRHQSALDCFEQTLEISPKCVVAWTCKGRTFAQLGWFDAAVDCIDVALELDPVDDCTWHEKGIALFQQGHHEAALECFERASEIFPQNSFYSFNRCEVLFALHRWEAGFSALRTAFVRHAVNTGHDVASLLHIVQSRCAASQQHFANVKRLVEIYSEAGELNALGIGLVRSLKWIDTQLFSDKALQSWCEVWQECGANHAELDIPLRIFRVGIENLIRKDERTLYDLVIYERMILQQALYGPASC